MKLTQNIWYTLYTKDSVTQSMRTKGAAASYRILSEFVHAIGKDVSEGNPSLNASFWETDKQAIARAKSLRKELEERFGAKPYKTPVAHWFSFNRSFEEYCAWDFSLDAVDETLKYIDELGPLQELKYRPPVHLSVSFDFWLKHASVDAGDKDMRSGMIAFLSPTSNTLALTLGLPFAEPTTEFKSYRDKLQEQAPIPLLDKYFYVRKICDNGKEYFRRLFK